MPCAPGFPWCSRPTRSRYIPANPDLLPTAQPRRPGSWRGARGRVAGPVPPCYTRLGRLPRVKSMRFDVNLAQAMAIAFQLGLTLAVSVVLGFLAGSFLDSRLATGPLFLIMGSLVGMVAGLYGSVTLVL